MYDIFVGELPFPGSNRFSIMYKRLESDARPPTAVRSDLPGSVERVIMKAMARDPNAGFPTAAELREALAPANLMS